jgi:hypothetical protein
MMVLYIGMMLPIFVFGCIPIAIFMIALSFLYGILCYPYVFLKSYGGSGACCMTVLFFPLVVILGIYLAIKEYVCETTAKLWMQYWMMATKGIGMILEA